MAPNHRPIPLVLSSALPQTRFEAILFNAHQRNSSLSNILHISVAGSTLYLYLIQLNSLLSLLANLKSLTQSKHANPNRVSVT